MSEIIGNTIVSKDLTAERSVVVALRTKDQPIELFQRLFEPRLVKEVKRYFHGESSLEQLYDDPLFPIVYNPELIVKSISKKTAEIYKQNTRAIAEAFLGPQVEDHLLRQTTQFADQPAVEIEDLDGNLYTIATYGVLSVDFDRNCVPVQIGNEAVGKQRQVVHQRRIAVLKNEEHAGQLVVLKNKDDETYIHDVIINTAVWMVNFVGSKGGIRLHPVAYDSRN